MKKYLITGGICFLFRYSRGVGSGIHQAIGWLIFVATSRETVYYKGTLGADDEDFKGKGM